jgi:hypothetical protein
LEDSGIGDVTAFAGGQKIRDHSGFPRMDAHIIEQANQHFVRLFQNLWYPVIDDDPHRQLY